MCACGGRADNVHVSPGVVLHEIGQLRQIFAWVSAINLTITTEGLVNQTRGSHLENIKTKRAQQLCIKPTGLLVDDVIKYMYRAGYGHYRTLATPL